MLRLCARAACALLLALQLFGAGVGAERSASAVPAPREVLGFEPGDDHQLADFRQLREYFTRLAAASDRVRLTVAGRSTGGNEMLVAAISSAENLAHVDRYRDIARRLALVESVSPEQAGELAREGKAIVWIDSGLHASEVATAQHAIVLAWRLAADESAVAREIRDNVIVVLAPCINPDGMSLVVDWYRRNLRTPWQDSPMPWLYHRYAGHDNNRDSFMQTQRETEIVNRLLYREWLPQITYNHHQGTWPPRIFVPPFPDPFNPNIDPEVMRGVDLVGGAMQHRFEQEDKDGVITRYQFSVWYNGSVRTTSYFHNMIGILTETGHASATPFTYRAADFPARLANGVPTLTPSVTYPHPWKGGTLRLRDAIDYMVTGSFGVLEVAARYRERFLRGIYDIGARQIERGRTDPPLAYIVPVNQHDEPAAMAFLATLMKGAVHVHRAAAPFAADGVTYPAGSYIVLLAQPFRPFAKDLLEPQVYPDLRTSAGGLPVPPYDVAGWTLAYQMGVRTVPVRTPFDTSHLELLEDAPRASGRLERAAIHTAMRDATIRAMGETSPLVRLGSRPKIRDAAVSWGYAIDPSANTAVIAINRLVSAGAAVSQVTEPWSPAPGVSLPSGTWLVRPPRTWGRALALRDSRTWGRALALRDSRTWGRPSGLPDVSALVHDLGLHAWEITRPPRARTPVRLARIGVYKSWVANADEGWTRWLLEQYGFPYESLTNDDVRGARLRDRVDVIVLPSQSPRQMLDGHQPNDRPATPGPWNPPPPEYQGGLGNAGVEALRAFVLAGGTLVALDQASDLVLDRFGGVFARIHDATEGLPRTTFYCPGSVLRIAVDPTQRVAWGMPDEAAADFDNSRAFETDAPEVRSVARYAAADRLLMSGWLLGADRLANRHAVLDVPFGRGRVVLFGFRPQFRGQPHGTFKLLFNALY